MNFQLFALLYAVIAACFIFPPPAFVSMEFTVKNFFNGYIGDVKNRFVDSQLRRTTVTTAVHTAILAIYFVGCEQYAIVDGIDVPRFAHVGVLLMVLVALGVCARAWYMNHTQFRSHPTVLALQPLVATTCRELLDTINAECANPEALVTGLGDQVLIVTDNWVVVSKPYSLLVVRQLDIDMSIVNGQDVPSMETGATLQILTIKVTSVQPGVKDFRLRLNSIEYGLVQARLNAPIRNVAQVVIKQSVNEQVMTEFLTIIAENSAVYLSRRDWPLARLRLSSNLVKAEYIGSLGLTNDSSSHTIDDEDDHACAGCMSARACVILSKNCGNMDDEQARYTGEAPTDQNTCKQCKCLSPMWCVPCVVKWFSSRQNQSHPEGWFGGKAPCPTCRATFCVFDVVDLTEAFE